MGLFEKPSNLIIKPINKTIVIIKRNRMEINYKLLLLTKIYLFKN